MSARVVAADSAVCAPPLGVALVGVGRWGRRWLDALGREPRVRLLWVCDPVPVSRADLPPGVGWAQRHGRCLADPRVEAVIIATPVHTHAELALDVVRAGRHALVEKPVATDGASLEVLLKQASRNAVLVCVNHLLLHHPAFRALELAIASGRIGAVRSVAAIRISAGNRPEECPWWTLAPHDVALIDRIAPELLRGELHYSARGSERRAVLSCPGLEARLFFSLSGVHKVRLFAAQGSRGTLVFDDMHHHPLALHEDAVELFSDQRFDERALRSKLGFGTPLDVSPGMPLDAALSDFVSCAARAKASGSATSESSHMQSVVGALERGCPFPGPLGAGVPLEVPA